MITVPGTLAPVLLDLEDLTAHKPIGMHHRRIDGAADMGARIFEDRNDAFVESLFTGWLSVGHRGTLQWSLIVPFDQDGSNSYFVDPPEEIGQKMLTRCA
jgi:hypothetical protein